MAQMDFLDADFNPTMNLNLKTKILMIGSTAYMDSYTSSTPLSQNLYNNLPFSSTSTKRKSPLLKMQKQKILMFLHHIPLFLDPQKPQRQKNTFLKLSNGTRTLLNLLIFLL